MHEMIKGEQPKKKRKSVFNIQKVKRQYGSKIFCHPDHLGSGTLLTDSIGNLVENIFYTPFGSEISG